MSYYLVTYYASKHLFVSSFVLCFSQVSEKDQSIILTDRGYDDCEKVLGRSIFDPRDPWAPFVVNGLKAKELFTKDKVTYRP